jgi:2-amino-4-hydroxy-6-hydroxymethyldihydropteridine diphosphokinase
MTRAVLSIGSNLGDRAANLDIARRSLRPWLRAESPVYETPPWGPVEQDDYLNAVLVVADPDATPRDWLDRAHQAEQAAGRVRDIRWGPRTLDVDVVSVTDGDREVTSADPELTLPHPRAHERAFVLVPWLAIDARARLSGRPVADWLGQLPDDDIALVRRVVVAP